MIKNLTAMAVAACLMGGTASAAVLDFVAEGNAYERGEAGDGSFFLQNANTGGVKVTFNSNYHPYFDEDDAGLGVCKVLDSNKQCNPSSDDNVSGLDEWVELVFDQAYDIANLFFRNADHNSINSSTDTLNIQVNGGSLTSYTFAQAHAATFTNVTSILFGYGGRSASQFYLSSASATPVPVPASLPLLIGGVGAIGWIARRRKAA